MNEKSNELNRIVGAVVESCAYGDSSITTEKVLGVCREENVVLTREIVVLQAINAGFTISSIAMLLNRSKRAVRSMTNNGYNHLRTLRAFKIAYEDSRKKMECVN